MLNTTSPPLPSVSGLASPTRDWVVAGAALAVGLCAFAIIFHDEIAAALGVWNDSDAFSHCYLVLPVAAYLAWDRRDWAMATALRPAPALALLAIPAAAAWFVADRLGIMEARQLLAMTLLQFMVASLFGLRMWRALSASLLYLFFLVPFGEFLVPSMQSLAVHFTTIGLNLLGIPNFADGVTIQIPEGTFLVHEACSGLRFLIALMAFSVLYSCIIYRSPLRRILFIAIAFVVAVVGNDLRVLGILLIAHFFGNTQAVETDHVLWGWLFYLIIGTVLVLIGLAFRQERRAPVRLGPPASGRGIGVSAIALAVVVLLAAVPRVAANYLDQLGADNASVAAGIGAPALAGCSMVRLPAAAEDTSDVGVSHSIAYRCDRDLFVLALHRYPGRIASRALFSSLRATEIAPGADIIRQTADIRLGGGPDAPIWRVTETQKDGRYIVIATALWLDGRPVEPGIVARVRQALNTVRRAPVSPVLAVVTHSGQDGLNSARAAVRRFLDHSEPIAQTVRESVLDPVR